MPEKKSFQHHGKGPHLQAGNGGNHGGHCHAITPGIAAEDLLVDERVCNKGGEKAHVEDVAAESQQSSVGKEQGLDHEHRGNGEECPKGSQKDRE